MALDSKTAAAVDPAPGIMARFVVVDPATNPMTKHAAHTSAGQTKLLPLLLLLLLLRIFGACCALDGEGAPWAHVQFSRFDMAMCPKKIEAEQCGEGQSREENKNTHSTARQCVLVCSLRDL